MCCFARPGEVVIPWTDDQENPFYRVCHMVYEDLAGQTDAKGRTLTIHKIPLLKEQVFITQEEAEGIDPMPGSAPRVAGEMAAASYLNYLLVNGGVIVPQFGDENDEAALEALRRIHPERKVVGVYTREIILGGGNIHCITQQQPKA